MNRQERRHVLKLLKRTPSPEPETCPTAADFLNRQARALATAMGFEGERLERATRHAESWILKQGMNRGNDESTT